MPSIPESRNLDHGSSRSSSVTSRSNLPSSSPSRKDSNFPDPSHIGTCSPLGSSLNDGPFPSGVGCSDQDECFDLEPLPGYRSDSRHNGEDARSSITITIGDHREDTSSKDACDFDGDIEEADPLFGGDHSALGKRLPGKRERGGATNSRKQIGKEEDLPVPASQVFSPDAAPLDLPALEEHLNNKVLFAEPFFVEGPSVCTAEEKVLFGYEDHESFPDRKSKRRRKRSKTLEIAGGQFSAPASAFTEKQSSSIQGRRTSLRRRDTYSQLEDEDKDDLESQPATPRVGPNRPTLQLSFSNYTNTTGAHSNLSAPTNSQTVSTGISSTLSTQDHPITRLSMFPPLMLLRDNTLDELKSNAIGPRKPPSGIWGVPILGTLLDFFIGIEGSNYAASLIQLELFRDFFQIMAANLHYEDPNVLPEAATYSSFRKFFLRTVPSILGFDFVSVFGYSIIFFSTWIIITGLALWRFYKMTKAYDPNRNVEGFENQQWIFSTPSRGTKVLNTALVFILTLLYLPLSKLAVDALVWSSDFWVVDNPYTSGGDNPILEPLGDAETFRDPLDFCYTTTMRLDSFNWAWLIILLAVATVLVYTLWFPYRMMMTIKDMLPHVSQFNELGLKRSPEEMDMEYQRLVDRDKSPLSFMYNAYRRKWGFYKPGYILVFKLSNLLIITVLSKNNCLFRGNTTKRMLVIQQIVLIVIMSALLGIHVFATPFVDKISNRSEMVSRIGYVLTAIIGLLVALNVSGSTVYNTTILYIIQACTYLGNIYFATIGTKIAASIVKRCQSRVDFSIDIFSPVLNLPKHIKRRVWQETLSTVLLCGTSYHMPLGHVIAFSLSDTERWPPYLLNFQGSVAERHIENLKIVKEIGISDYEHCIHLSRSSVGERLKHLAWIIQTKYAGPDAYFRPTKPPFPNGVSSYFGKAFVVPFPPTLVMRYDQGPNSSVQLTLLDEFEEFVRQNGSDQVIDKRMVRRALRAMDGEEILAPFVNSVQVGPPRNKLIDKVLGIGPGGKSNKSGGIPSGPSFTMTTPVSYLYGILKISRREDQDWQGYNFASGFKVSVIYSKGKRQDTNGTVIDVKEEIEVGASSAFGLHDDFCMTASLHRLFRDNDILIRERVPGIEFLLKRYRKDFANEAWEKERTMGYSFLCDIFDRPSFANANELRAALTRTECCSLLKELPDRYRGSITLLFQRLEAINRSPVHQWWWCLFDDFWRKNSRDYKVLRRHRRSFSPSYPSSIAYRPMSRQELITFLERRGLWKQDGRKGIFNRGFLNRIYFYLNEIVFEADSDRGDLGVRGGKVGKGRREKEIEKEKKKHEARKDRQQGTVVSVGLGTRPDNVTRHHLGSLDQAPKKADDAPARHGGKGTITRSPGNSPSTMYTGGGTDHDIPNAIDRSAYVWEQRLSSRSDESRKMRIWGKIMEWLDLYPVSKDLSRQRLYLFVKLRNGRYVLDRDDHLDSTGYERGREATC
ncbi:hypothetical protein IE53DRAFT_316116 [Violaceomyces palustris]|uniref:Uncharacterized protein n=1 Tax=Violaceomyces palustris TaxID=1673888 RepID=A0ACD0NWX0_9BASI|nr:hypothetical protein IE53DRAFT_316116 [Violaceomyces palustris]